MMRRLAKSLRIPSWFIAEDGDAMGSAYERGTLIAVMIYLSDRGFAVLRKGDEVAGMSKSWLKLIRYWCSGVQ